MKLQKRQTTVEKETDARQEKQCDCVRLKAEKCLVRPLPGIYLDYLRHDLSSVV